MQKKKAMKKKKTWEEGKREGRSMWGDLHYERVGLRCLKPLRGAGKLKKKGFTKTGGGKQF